MTCSACSAHVEKAVGKVAGVAAVTVNLLGSSMLVDYDDTRTGPSAIIRAVQDAGYGAALPASDEKQGAGPAAPAARVMEAELAGMKRRFVISLVFLIPLF